LHHLSRVLDPGAKDVSENAKYLHDRNEEEVRVLSALKLLVEITRHKIVPCIECCDNGVVHRGIPFGFERRLPKKWSRR
jgi:hypothetical protein